MKSPQLFNRIALASMAIATVSALTACGGGGGSEGSGTSTGAAPAPIAETPKPLSVTGTVTGFGSVIIDGVKYDDSVANVVVDNGGAQASPLPLGDLKLGMSVNATVENGKLTQVTVRAAMFGPIERIQTAAATFSIFGQTVKIVTDGPTPTSFEGVGGLSSLAVNDLVEVHGTLDANRVVVATRVERKAKNSVESVRLGGAITALDTTAKTFRLNELVVDYAIASVTPAGQTLVNNTEVVAFGSAAPSGGRFTAQTLRVRSADEGTPLIVGGRVGGYVSLSDFSVGGQRVNAASAALEGGTAADVANGQPVAAEGKVVSGVLRAEKLRVIKTSVDVLASLKGEVSGFVSDANFKLRGATVNAASATAFFGGTKQDLGNGSNVQIQGTIRGDVFLGEKVEFLKSTASETVKVSGELRDWDAATQSFRLMGHSARLAQNVQVEGGSVAELANGRRVSLEGQADANGVVVVSKLELKPEVVIQTVTVLSGRAYDVTPSSFRLPGGLLITHSSATVFEAGSSTDVSNGALVYVKGRLNASKQGLFAYWVDVVKGDAPTARVLGTVSGFASRSSFRVNGQRVDASTADIVDGQLSSLADGAVVMATGSLVDIEGRRVFVATKLRFMQ